ncbi:Vitamin D 25-hydroxylase [Chionoecetes opilio]|uniref:Vitamin D 25-hydroxylase n=1 Tax=Chionoecetes opilio TaxID=41210 RepID=A0A8J8WKY3_CHIOP|nr:Vitamin D 25-hydroxylase [Chionoecetes opilio]
MGVQEEMDEHRATLKPGPPRDLIDGYLMEMDNKKDDPDTTCSKMDLAFLLINLFFAGSETTTSTLTWLLYYLATHPRVQDKLQAEIDLVLPEGQQATLDDKPRLPYTEAVIHETLRKSCLVPIGLQQGAVLNGAIFTIHHDTRYWDNPDEFLPERWLNDEGKFVTKKEGFLPFGIDPDRDHLASPRRVAATNRHASD